MSRTTLGLLSAIAVLGLAAPAHAQAACGDTGATASCSLSGVTVTTTVQNIVYMAIDVNNFGLTAPTGADFSGGSTATITDATAQTLTVKANAAWTLTVKGAAWSGTGNNSKAPGDLSWNVNGGGTFTAMTTSAATVLTGSATGSTTAAIGYKTTWNLTTDTPGTYTMALTYTLSAP